MKIISNTEIEFDVKDSIAQPSLFLRDFITDDGDEVVPLPLINDWQLRLIIEFLERHSTDPFTIVKPLESDNYVDDCPEWYFKFITKLSHEEVTTLLMAANFLNIDPLLDLCFSYIKSEINKTNTTQEIADMFGIEGTFTEVDTMEKLDELDKKYPWAHIKEDSDDEDS